jgi:hypothetical protein
VGGGAREELERVLSERDFGGHVLTRDYTYFLSGNLRIVVD